MLVEEERYWYCIAFQVIPAGEILHENYGVSSADKVPHKILDTPQNWCFVDLGVATLSFGANSHQCKYVKNWLENAQINKINSLNT